MSSGFPAMRSVVLDTLHPRDLAEFYRALLGCSYRPGDEPPAEGDPDPKGADWLVLLPPDGHGRLAFQRVDRLEEPTWPDAAVPQQLHLDLSGPKATVRGGRPGQLLKALGKRAYCAGTRFFLSCVAALRSHPAVTMTEPQPVPPVGDALLLATLRRLL